MGISQEELAGRAGLHRTYVADIERGARNPSLESINKLANALELSLSALFGPAANQLSDTYPGAADKADNVVDILLVEDNPSDIELTLQAFKKAHLTNRVHVARDGEEALAFIFAVGPYAHRKNDERPQVILLDLNLPKVGGREVLRRIKTDMRTKNIPVIILTISELGSDIIECNRLGANGYIVKPVDFQRLAKVTPQLDFRWTLFTS